MPNPSVYLAPQDDGPEVGVASASALVEWDATSMAFPAVLAFEQWQAIGETLGRMEKSVNWWVGDWLNYGERQYGEKYTQAVQETGRRKQTLTNIAWVAGRVEISRRREILPWSVHAEVAKLEPEEQERILAEAERKDWSVRETREAVQALKNAVAPAPVTPKVAPPTPDAEPTAEEPTPEPAAALVLESEPFSPGATAAPPERSEAEYVAELRALMEENRELDELVQSLQTTDHGKEIARLALKYNQLEGRLRQEITKANEAVKQAKYYGDALKKIRGVLRVERNEEILPRLLELGV